MHREEEAKIIMRAALWYIAVGPFVAYIIMATSGHLGSGPSNGAEQLVLLLGVVFSYLLGSGPAMVIGIIWSIPIFYMRHVMNSGIGAICKMVLLGPISGSILGACFGFIFTRGSQFLSEYITLGGIGGSITAVIVYVKLGLIRLEDVFGQYGKEERPN